MTKEHKIALGIYTIIIVLTSVLTTSYVYTHCGKQNRIKQDIEHRNKIKQLEMTMNRYDGYLEELGYGN